jgi:putative ABC transport system permease protein
MLVSFIKIAIRSLRKNALFSLINIFGLAIGITCFTIIFLLVEHEFSFDKFHHNPQEVFRIVKNFVNDDGTVIPDATTPPALASALRQNLPEVASVTRLFPNWGRKYLMESGDKRFYETELIRVDSSFFDVFDFLFVDGNSQNPFNGTHSILITQAAAKKYFGDENPIHKVIRINVNNGTDYIVTGVLKNVPKNSHFTFQFLVPFESRRDPNVDWNWYSFYTYVRLKPNSIPALFETKLKNIFKKFQPNSTNQVYMQALTDIHLKSKLKWELAVNGDLSYVRILMVIGIFVILIASINYVNLVVAQSAKRAKEIGVRKVSGAFKRLLTAQFLVESILTVLVSLCISLVIVNLLLPFAQTIFGIAILDLIFQSQWIWWILPSIVLFVGFFAGLYPALYLSSLEPLRVLKGGFISSHGGVSLRQGLVIFQFVISTVLIIGLLIITRQLIFIRESDLGFDQKNILLLPNIRGGNNPEPMLAKHIW